MQPDHPLRKIIDELTFLLKEAYVEAPKFCNTSVPTPPDGSFLHHYWFSPTAKGKQAWKGYNVIPPAAKG